jgi:hypothetical protein
LECFASDSQCFASDSQCFASDSQCFASTSQCFVSPSHCFASYLECFASDLECFVGNLEFTDAGGGQAAIKAACTQQHLPQGGYATQGCRGSDRNDFSGLCLKSGRRVFAKQKPDREGGLGSRFRRKPKPLLTRGLLLGAALPEKWFAESLPSRSPTVEGGLGSRFRRKPKPLLTRGLLLGDFSVSEG